MRIEYTRDGKAFSLDIDDQKFSDDNISVSVKNASDRTSVTVTALKEVTLADAEIIYPYEFQPADRILPNGYQSWTETHPFAPGEFLNDVTKLPGALKEKYHFASYGSQAFWKYRKHEAVGFDFGSVTGHEDVFFGNLNYRRAYLLIRFDKDGKRILLESDVAGRSLKAGEEFTVFDYVTGKDGEDYFSRFTPRTGKKLFGYTSWYNHYQDINEELILDALGGADERFELFQIDDGFETFVGDWMEIDPAKFPNGLTPIVERIHERGMMAGIWLAPLVAETKSRVFREHPDWFAKAADGSFLYGGSNWSSFVPFDFNHPEAEAYVRRCLRAHREMGFDFFKLDFLYAVNLCPIAGKTRSETAEHAYSILREELEGRLILGCGATLSNAFERFDYCRIGPDVSLTFDDVFYMRLFHPERVSTKVTLQNTIFRSSLDGRVFLNDPDVFLLRDNNMKLSVPRRTALTKMNALFGSLLMTSDKVNEYDPAKKAVLEDALAIFRRAVRTGFTAEGDRVTAHFELDGKKRTFSYDPKRGVLEER